MIYKWLELKRQNWVFKVISFLGRERLGKSHEETQRCRLNFVFCGLDFLKLFNTLLSERSRGVVQLIKVSNLKQLEKLKNYGES
jgi:hypothetical protein